MSRLGRLVAGWTCLALVLPTSGGGRRVTTSPPRPLASGVFDPLLEQLREPYVELFERAGILEFNAAQIARMREYLRNVQSYCAGEYRRRGREHESEFRRRQDELLANQAISVAYDNKRAKLDLTEEWPASSGRSNTRRPPARTTTAGSDTVKTSGFATWLTGGRDDI